jgi:hypothetical protein
MAITQECLSSLADLAVFIWEKANNGYLKPLILAAFGVKILTRLLIRTGLSEARDLAATLVAGLICAAVILVTESPVRKTVSANLRQCTAPEAKVASIKRPGAASSRGSE